MKILKLFKMKRSAPDSEGGGGESGGEGDGAPDAKRARISEAEVRSLRAQNAAKDEEIAAQAEEMAAQAAEIVELAAQAATLQALTPLPVLNVSAQSIFKGRATLTWDTQSGGGTPTHFIIGAIDATTGARHENIAREEGADCRGGVTLAPCTERGAGGRARGERSGDGSTGRSTCGPGSNPPGSHSTPGAQRERPKHL